MITLPYSYPWILRKVLNGHNNILDVGCGDGQTGAAINYDHKYEMTGIDIYSPDIEKIKLDPYYHDGVIVDLRKSFPSNIASTNFDAIFSSQVVEHLDKKDALELISRIEKMPTKLIIIATTNGFIPFQPLDGEEDSNPYQVHKSGWSVEEFESMGYTVFGQAMKLFWTPPNGILHTTKSPLLRWIYIAIAYLLSPIAYYFPRQATYLIAYKHRHSYKMLEPVES